MLSIEEYSIPDIGLKKEKSFDPLSTYDVKIRQVSIRIFGGPNEIFIICKCNYLRPFILSLSSQPIFSEIPSTKDTSVCTYSNS